MSELTGKDTQNKDPLSFIYHFKCQACQLEFIIFSWDANWEDHLVPFCPECGKKEITFFYKKSSDKPIFELQYDE